MYREDGPRAVLQSGFAALPVVGVVVATHILRRDVFSRPRLGCINLHFGKAPDFRGSSPGFWELYHGVAEVGITVHWVTDTLDGGDILEQEVFPLDIAPPGDPVEYLRDFQKRVLMPNGVDCWAALTRIAAGDCSGEPQDRARGDSAPPFTPTGGSSGGA